YLQNRKQSALSQLAPYVGLPNPCVSSLNEYAQTPGKLLFVTDILGRQIDPNSKNCVKILNFDNGTQQRIYEME
ncbi:MAG: hypothetical protein NWS74_08570, partial [Salibacteraceae bacterium]|nr:hypothetical protein [Salibacteraceae bacterium]